MAELRMADATPSACCAPEAQETCCDPGDKDACCGSAAVGGTCGCSAGDAPAEPDIREAVRARYAAAARATGNGTGCCSEFDTRDARGEEVWGSALYGDEAAGAPAASSP